MYHIIDRPARSERGEVPDFPIFSDENTAAFNQLQNMIRAGEQPFQVGSVFVLEPSSGNIQRRNPNSSTSSLSSRRRKNLSRRFTSHWGDETEDAQSARFGSRPRSDSRSRAGSSVITQDMDLGLERTNVAAFAIEEEAAAEEATPTTDLPSCIREMVISYTLQTIWKGLETDAHQLRKELQYRADIDEPAASSTITPSCTTSPALGKSYLWSSLLHLRNQQNPLLRASTGDKLEQLERLRAQERAGTPSKSKTWKSRGFVTAATEEEVRRGFLAGMEALIMSEQTCDSRLQCALFDGGVRPPLGDVAMCIIDANAQPSAHLRAWLRSEIEESVELIPKRWLSIFGQDWD